jgi:hypothetical protein
VLNKPLRQSEVTSGGSKNLTLLTATKQKGKLGWLFQAYFDERFTAQARDTRIVKHYANRLPIK